MSLNFVLYLCTSKNNLIETGVLFFSFIFYIMKTGPPLLRTIMKTTVIFAADATFSKSSIIKNYKLFYYHLLLIHIKLVIHNSSFPFYFFVPFCFKKNNQMTRNNNNNNKLRNRGSLFSFSGLNNLMLFFFVSSGLLPEIRSIYYIQVPKLSEVVVAMKYHQDKHIEVLLHARITY